MMQTSPWSWWMLPPGSGVSACPGTAAQFRVAAVGQRRAVGGDSLLVGHKSTTVTELVYRKQIRPVLQTGATAMDRIFGATGQAASDSNRHSADERPESVDDDRAS